MAGSGNLFKNSGSKPTGSSRPTRLLYMLGNIDEVTYKKFLEDNATEPERAVFIFPSNENHHRDHSLYSEKSGGGLGRPAGHFGKQGWPVLGLPTMPPVPRDLPKAAVKDIWRAIGYGMNVVLPIRQHDPSTGYFKKPLKDNPNYEPSFWGLNAGAPDTVLSGYYIDQLDIIQQFLTGKKDINTIDPEFAAAYKEGQAAQSTPNKWFQKKSSSPAKKSENIPSPPSPIEKVNDNVAEELENGEAKHTLEVAPSSKTKHTFKRSTEILSDEKFQKIITKLESDNWKVSDIQQTKSKEPFREVTQGEQSFRIYADKITTNRDDLDTFKKMLEIFKEMHREKSIPKITTHEKARAVWEEALKAVYPSLKLDDVVTIKDETPTPEPTSKKTTPESPGKKL